MVDFGQLGVDAASTAGVAAARPVSVVVQVRRVRVVGRWGHRLPGPVVVVVHHPVVVVVSHGTAASVVTKNFTVGRNLCRKKNR